MKRTLHVLTAAGAIAHHGFELEVASRRTAAALRFEAAVGGGTPILGPLASDLVANHAALAAAKRSARRSAGIVRVVRGSL